MDRDYLVRAYVDECQSIYDISRATGISKTHVYNLLRKHGIQTRPRGGKIKDLVGKHIGQLVVLRLTRSEGVAYWWCRCSCGNEIEASSHRLQGKAGQHHCGCKPRHKGHGGITKTLWWWIEYCARVRDLPLEITIEQAWELFLTQDGKCALSGVVITMPKHDTQKKKPVYTASLDRIDSSKGYVLGNVQWVHKDVNMLKNNFTEQELVRWCGLIWKTKKKSLR